MARLQLPWLCQSRGFNEKTQRRRKTRRTEPGNVYSSIDSSKIVPFFFFFFFSYFFQLEKNRLPLISLWNTYRRVHVPWFLGWETTPMNGRWKRRSSCSLRESARFRGCPSFWNTFRASVCWIFSSADYVNHRPSVTWSVIRSNPFLPLVSGQNPPAAGWPGVWERAASEGEFSFDRSPSSSFPLWTLILAEIDWSFDVESFLLVKRVISLLRIRVEYYLLSLCLSFFFNSGEWLLSFFAFFLFR